MRRRLYEGPMTGWTKQELNEAAAGHVDFNLLNPGLYINPKDVQTILERHANEELKRRGYAS